MFKTKTMALTVAIGLMCSSNLLAQMDNSRPGGLFGSEGYTSKGLMGRSESTVGGYFTGQGFGATNGNLSGQGFGVTNGNITGQTFGAPLGSGLLFLLTAGIGYSALKSKKTQKQNQNGKEK